MKMVKTFFKIAGFVIIAAIVICGVSYLTDRNDFGHWSIRTNSVEHNQLSWINFYWTNDSFGRKHFDKTAMLVYAKVQGVPQVFSFQFDLGSNLTMLYERNLNSAIRRYPVLSQYTGKLKSNLQFWNKNKAFKKLALDFKNTTATAENCFIRRNYGNDLSFDKKNNDPLPLGTIGADLFQNKILIIDYLNNRFAICDVLPDALHISFTKMSLDHNGRALIPLLFRNKKYNALFDNGSSIFPLLVTDDKINQFFSLPPSDTIAVSSWGTVHNVIGHPLKEPFELGGQKFSGTMIYVDYRKEARTSEYDLITGNALFWNKTIIIDFKNKQFGVL